MQLVKKLRDAANGVGSLKSKQGDYGLCDDAADALEAAKQAMREIKDIGRREDDWMSAEASIAKEWLAEYDVE